MKRLKVKKGFTLVECVVAMAVLAIMSLLLTMLLSITLRQRNANMSLEKGIDEQIANIVANAGDSDAEEIKSDIKLYDSDGVELSDEIPGNKEGASAEKIEHSGDGMKMDSLDYDFDDYEKFENIANGKIPGGEETPEKGYEKEKCFGALSVKDGKVTITEASRGGKRKDGTIDAAVVTGVEYEYYIVKWRITFEANEVAPEKSIKIRIPKSGKLTSWTNVAGKATVDALSDTAVRVEPEEKGNCESDIVFNISSEDIDEYGSVSKFFTDVGEGNSVIVNIKY